jgi:hypothetical protein
VRLLGLFAKLDYHWASVTPVNASLDTEPSMRRYATFALLLTILCFLAFPAQAFGQDGGEAAKSPLIGYVILVLGLLLGWSPLVRPSRRKKKFSFET